MPDKTMDLKGLACPLPILKARKALSELPKGATLEVLATDPGSVEDFQRGHRQRAPRAQRGRGRLSVRVAAFGLSALVIPELAEGEYPGPRVRAWRAWSATPDPGSRFARRDDR
jgi:TusA-related sulfurtransferase